MQVDAYPTLPFPPTMSGQPSRNRNATEIHWNPPASAKRDDPSTPPPGLTLDAVSPLKTRRLLPPSRRVDDGDDELGMESPPKVVRQYRIKTPTHSPALTFLTNNMEGRSGSTTSEADRQQAQNASLGAPVAGDRISDFIEDEDTFEQLNDTIYASGSPTFLNRIESARSMTSRSMASNSTQAEMEFYIHRKNNDSSSIASHKIAPPQWIDSSRETSPPHHAVLQRRRVMLAQSTAMLRSHRPAWDRTESMRSFCSQTSSAAWSLGGSTIGGSTIGGISRASSRKSFQSSNTGSQQSRTPTPPDHVRMTSCGTTGKPRQIVANNSIVEYAHRPVPEMPSCEVRTTIPTPRTAATTKEAQCIGIGDGVVRETEVPKPSLLEDDDTAGDLWLMANKLSVNAGPSSETGGNPNKQERDSADDPSLVVFGGPWQPQAGGSFTLYRRTD